jgi:nucleoside-diphosphate-sugar epimerase
VGTPHIVVTGGTGFVGRHVVGRLLAQGADVTVISRRRDVAERLPWFPRVTFIESDIHGGDARLLETIATAQVLVHLAWPGLPNYLDPIHYEQTLWSDYRFLKSCMEAGAKELLVTGTCLEYGLQDGALRPTAPIRPTTSYGVAKAALHNFLTLLASDAGVGLKWVRLFYVYGEGQNANSLLAHLDRAILRGEKVFDMSRGDQLRDYLPVEEAASRIVRWARVPRVSGILNCCSGQPISVRSLVERRLAERKAQLTLNLGALPYPKYEPMAFWGVPSDISPAGDAVIDSATMAVPA